MFIMRKLIVAKKQQSTGNEHHNKENLNETTRGLSKCLQQMSPGWPLF